LETGQGADEDGADETVLAVSTEDGRVLFFSTAVEDLGAPPAEDKTLPVARLVGQLGGKEAGVSGRIKDFAALPVEDAEGKRQFYIVTGSSDGRIRLWHVDADELRGADKAKTETKAETKQVGKLLGTYETQNRITCVAAFVMIPRPQGAEESEYEFESEESEDSEDE
jgi:protein MAK11